MSKYKNLITQLNIDESLTKKKKGKKKFNKVKQSIPLVEDLNLSADLLFLPTTKQNFKYLLVIVDLASDEFDIEPLKSKEPKEIIKAMDTIFKRKYLNKPKASFLTDDGNEFKGEVNKYFKDLNVLRRVALPGRHKQNSSVESLNKILGRFLNGYMNSKELNTGKVYKEWTDIVDTLRTELNKIRKKTMPVNPRTVIYDFPDTHEEPEFNIGNYVHIALDKPRNALNEELQGNFRQGDYRYDPVPKKITKIFYYPAGYRYMVSGITNASYAEWELIKSDYNDDEDEVDEIKEIIDMTYNRKEKMWYYKIWMFGERKTNSGWYSRQSLLETIEEDALQEFIDLYKSKLKKKKK